MYTLGIAHQLYTTTSKYHQFTSEHKLFPSYCGSCCYAKTPLFSVRSSSNGRLCKAADREDEHTFPLLNQPVTDRERALTKCAQCDLDMEDSRSQTTWQTKFRYGCTLCTDFKPSSRNFNAERHVWYDANKFHGHIQCLSIIRYISRRMSCTSDAIAVMYQPLLGIVAVDSVT